MATQNFNRNLFLNLYQFRSVPQSYPTLCVPMDCCTPGFPVTNSQRLLKLMPIESVMPSNHLILWHPLLLLPPNPPSIRVFSNESTFLMRWPKYWRRLLRVLWTVRRSNQSILKISPGCSLEGMMLKLKLPIHWPPHPES